MLTLDTLQRIAERAPSGRLAEAGPPAARREPIEERVGGGFAPAIVEALVALVGLGGRDGARDLARRA